MLNQMGVTLIGDADEFEVDEAIVNGSVADVFNYSQAKTLVLFCNGMWCGQSPASMASLLYASVILLRKSSGFVVACKLGKYWA